MNPADSVKERAGAEIRKWREELGLSQDSIAKLFGWNRDAMSKIETGKNNLSLHDYLTIVMFLREAAPPDHPALALANQLTYGGIRRGPRA